MVSVIGQVFERAKELSTIVQVKQCCKGTLLLHRMCICKDLLVYLLEKKIPTEVILNLVIALNNISILG